MITAGRHGTVSTSTLMQAHLTTKFRERKSIAATTKSNADDGKINDKEMHTPLTLIRQDHTRTVEENMITSETRNLY